MNANEQVLLADAELGAHRFGRAVLDDAQPHRVAQRRWQPVDAGERAREFLALLGDLVGARLQGRDAVRCAFAALVVVERIVVQIGAAAPRGAGGRTAQIIAAGSMSSLEKRVTLYGSRCALDPGFNPSRSRSASHSGRGISTSM